MSFQWFKSSLRRWLLIISGLAFASCGFISDEPVQNGDIYQNSELSGSCSIDPDAFAKIMDEDIQAQIDCLEKNFVQFSKYVKRPSLESIGRRELSVFVEDFFPSNASMIMDGLTLLFKVNLIFIDDQTDQISTEGMRRLFKLLAHANKNAARMNRAFADYDAGKVTLAQLRQVFIDSLSALANAGIESMSHGKSAELSITETVRDVSGKFKELTISEEDLKVAQIVKKLFVGGEKDVITCDELRDFLSRMRPLAALTFDMLYVNEYKLEGTQSYASFILDRVDSLFDNIPLERDGVLLTHEDAAYVANYAGMSNSDKLEQTFRSAKAHLFTPKDANGLNARDIKLLRVYAKAYLKTFLTWNRVQTSLDAKNTQPRAFVAEILDKWSTEMIALVDPALFPEEIGLSRFLDDVAAAWEFEHKDIQLGRSIMLLKPLLIGGKAATLSPLEVDRLLPKLKLVTLTVYDAIVFSRSERPKREIYHFALDMLDSLNQFLHPGDDFEIAFLTKGLENFKVFVPQASLPVVTGMIEGFPTIKTKLFGGHKEVVLFKEFRQIVEEVRSLVETLHLSEITLDLYPQEFASTKLVKSLPYRHHPDYKRFSVQRLERFKRDFKHVFSKLHYFIDDENLQTYQTNIVRTRDGFTLNMLLRQAARLVLSRYGHIEDGQAMLSLEEIDSMMKQFKPLLEPMGLWTKKIDTFARNMLLLSDLFQSRSNGNGSMDVDEAVEYIGMVIVSVEIQSRLMQAYPKYCDNVGTEEIAFDTPCYRPAFFDVLFKDLKLGKKLPKLKAYVDSVPKSESLKFLRGVEGFARDYDDEAIPMAKRDLVLLVGAMLNIESTFVRFDRVDENNQLDQSELDQAYYIYRDGIVTVAELSEDQEQYTKSIFLYMVEKMEKPSPGALFIFHNNPLRGNITAKRLNIGTLLYYLVQE